MERSIYAAFLVWTVFQNNQKVDNDKFFYTEKELINAKRMIELKNYYL